MKAVIGVGVWVLVLVCVEAWPNYFDTWSMSRRSTCGKQNDKCYTTDQCCKHFVCVAFDDLLGAGKAAGGLNQEIPGFCGREKDLQQCNTHDDCDPNSKCVSLGPQTRRYCVTQPPRHRYQSYKTPSGGLGSSCQSNSDCREFTADFKHKLCCQKISRGRMGSKQVCDRLIDPMMTKCIPHL